MTPATAAPTIDDQIAMSSAVAEYIRAMHKFDEASLRFNNACSKVRSIVGKNNQFVTKVDYQSFLVVTDDQEDFDITPINII